MLQSVKAINFSSCPLYHVKEAFFFFAFFPILYWAIKAYGKLNMGNFSIHWNTLPTLFYSFCFIIFHASSYALLIFLNPHAPSLVSGVFVEAGPQHLHSVYTLYT